MWRCLALVVTVSACDVVFPLDDLPPGDAPPPLTPNAVFVTSIPFAADRRLVEADQECSRLASNAGIEGEFVAWLSDSSRAAIEPLVNSRGWVRTDGEPVADTLEELIARGPRVPITFSENAVSLADLPSTLVRTGTRSTGQVTDQTCNDWTTTDSNARGLSGDFVYGGDQFTQQVDTPCNEEQRLLCFGHGKRVELPLSAPTRPIVFVTAAPWQPDRGLADADAFCQAEAISHFPEKTFRAVLTDNGELSSRFPQGSTVFSRVDGVVVGTVVMPGSTLSAFINVTAAGQLGSADQAWTGAQNNEPSSTQACGNWSNAGATGVVGAVNSSVEALDSVHTSCTQPFPIYCAEVP